MDLNSLPNVAASAAHDSLRWRLRALLEQPRVLARKGLLSVSLTIDSPLSAAVPRLREGDLCWAGANGAQRLFGRGLAFSHRCGGRERLSRLTQVLQTIERDWLRLDADDSGGGPRLFTGFAFDDEDQMDFGPWRGFPNAGLYLPELLLQESPDGCRLTLSAADRHLAPSLQVERWLGLLATLCDDAQHSPIPKAQALQRLSSTPEDAAWLRLAEQAIDAIDGSELEKLVLYRQVKLGLSQPLAAHELATLMQRSYPACRLFVTRQGGRTLVSASPERLVAKHDREITIDVLAGTVHRSSSPSLDAELAQRLLSEPKMRLEHRLVAESVSAAVQALCAELDTSQPPGILRLRNVQHLWSELRGRVLNDTHLLDLAAALHPTPAVNGAPRNLALQWLRRHGQAQRGWYCGAGGWLDVRGNGELDVLLRCALIGGDSAELFAGAGLVAGSQAADELAETELKLKAVLSSLTAAR